MRTFRSIAVHPSGRVDPDKTTLECERDGCTNVITIGGSYSFVVTFATTGPLNIPAFQCGDEQHFACSPECAAEAARVCILEHLIPAHAQKVGETR